LQVTIVRCDSGDYFSGKPLGGITPKIILINGQRLVELMIEYGVGVSTVRTIALKRVDSDYFEDA
jgi:restriction endonuclease Mrr